ncbi:MAG: hypothetical protein ACHQ5A_07590, partial [Opitutales bacterium]
HIIGALQPTTALRVKRATPANHTSSVIAVHIQAGSEAREERSEAPGLSALGGYRVLLDRPAGRAGEEIRPDIREACPDHHEHVIRVLVLGPANLYDQPPPDETRVVSDAMRAGFVVLACRRLSVISRELSGEAYLLQVCCPARRTTRGLQ